MEKEIKLREPLGVSAAIESSRLLAEVAGELGRKKVLDLGTGSGYVAIYLAKMGASVTAVDISNFAVGVAKENAKNNNVSFSIFQSDLFENINETYDLIVWNAPVGDAKGNRFMDVLKSIIRKVPVFYKLAQAITYKLYLKERLELDKRVIREALEYLQVNGIILLIAIDGEELILSPFAKNLGYKVEVFDSTALRRTIKASFLLFQKND